MIELNIEGNGNEPKLYALGDTNYIIRTTHSERTGWVLGVYTRDDDAIVTNLHILAEEGRNLTWRYHASFPLLPDGDLMVFRHIGSNSTEITFDNFGEDGDWGVYYLTRGEQVQYGVSRY